MKCPIAAGWRTEIQRPRHASPIVTLLVGALAPLAAIGDLDPTFAEHGLLSLPVGIFGASAVGIEQQPDESSFWLATQVGISPSYEYWMAAIRIRPSAPTALLPWTSSDLKTLPAQWYGNRMERSCWPAPPEGRMAAKISQLPGSTATALSMRDSAMPAR